MCGRPPCSHGQLTRDQSPRAEVGRVAVVERPEDAASTHRLYTISTITDLLGVTRNQVRAWTRAGLIEPVRVDGGVWYFDFRQVSAASTICDLISRGVTPGSIRRQLKRLQGWVPDVEQPLAQLAPIEAGGELFIRLAKGDLAAADGQLQLDFDREANEESIPPTLKLVTGPTTASEWHALAVQQEPRGGRSVVPGCAAGWRGGRPDRL